MSLLLPHPAQVLWTGSLYCRSRRYLQEFNTRITCASPHRSPDTAILRDLQLSRAGLSTIQCSNPCWQKDTRMCDGSPKEKLVGGGVRPKQYRTSSSPRPMSRSAHCERILGTTTCLRNTTDSPQKTCLQVVARQRAGTNATSLQQGLIRGVSGSGPPCGNGI
jgi:hypothetical protein